MMGRPISLSKDDIQGLLEVKWLEGCTWSDEVHSTTKRTLEKLIRNDLVVEERDSVTDEISYHLTDEGRKLALQHEVR